MVACYIPSRSLGQFFRTSLGSIGLKVISTFLALGVTALIARVLGAESYGIYAYVLVSITLISIPVQFGLPDIVVRETAKAYTEKNYELIKGILRWADIRAIRLSLLLIVTSIFIATQYSSNLSEVQVMAFLIGLSLIPILSLEKLRGAALRGFQKVVIGQLPDQCFRPVFNILFVLLVIIYIPSIELNAAHAMSLHVMAATAALLITHLLLRYFKPPEINVSSAQVESRTWTLSVIPITLTAGATVINSYADIFMLGVFSSAQDVGIYRVAALAATLAAFSLGPMTAMVAPNFAQLHAAGEHQRLQQLVTITSRVTFLISLPVIIIFLIYGSEIIIFIFGVEFKGAYVPLVVLSLGQAVNTGMGPVGLLLTMAGNEKIAMRNVLTAAVFNVLLNLILIPLLGMVGAAIATCITLVLCNILLWISAKRLLGINSSAINFSKIN